MRKKPSKPASSQPVAIPPRIFTQGNLAIKPCRHGVMLYNLNDMFIGKALDLYGEWCNVELDSLGQILRPGDIVLDVGANIGTHTVFFARKVAPGGSVYALEPQRFTFELLCANIALNGLLNVIPLQVGAGAIAGSVCIPLLDPASPQNFGSLHLLGHSGGDPVEVKPIDALDLPHCRLIKIDVEGMELAVLRGGEKTIRACRPLLFVENNDREGAPEVVQALFDLDYTCWWHIAPYYNPNNVFHNPENVFANLVPEANMVCAPKEINLNITGFEPVMGAADNWYQALVRQKQAREAK